MFCIHCFHRKTRVINSRRHKKRPIIWRRRTCEQCHTVFTSYERATLDGRPVLHHDGESTPFAMGTLIVSIARCFDHQKQQAGAISYDIAQTVEEQLLLYGKPLSSDDISVTTYVTLQRFDPIAALQYAARHGLIHTR